MSTLNTSERNHLWIDLVFRFLVLKWIISPIFNFMSKIDIIKFLWIFFSAKWWVFIFNIEEQHREWECFYLLLFWFSKFKWYLCVQRSRERIAIVQRWFRHFIFGAKTPIKIILVERFRVLVFSSSENKNDYFLCRVSKNDVEF